MDQHPCFRPCFDAAYAAFVGTDNRAKSLSTLQTHASPSASKAERRSGRNEVVQLTTPQKLTFIARSNSARGSVTDDPDTDTPALFTRRCTRPKASPSSLAKALTGSISDTSQG